MQCGRPAANVRMFSAAVLEMRAFGSRESKETWEGADRVVPVPALSLRGPDDTMKQAANRAKRVQSTAETVIFRGSSRMHWTSRNASATGMLLEMPLDVVPAPYVRMQFKVAPEG